MENLIKFLIMLSNFTLFCLGLLAFITIIYGLVVFNHGVDFKSIKTTKRNNR